MNKETDDIDDSDLIDSGGGGINESIVRYLSNPDCDIVIGWGGYVRQYQEGESYEEYPINEMELIEMSTVYGEIFYKLKKASENMYTGFFYKTTDLDQLYDFYTLMDTCYNF